MKITHKQTKEMLKIIEALRRYCHVVGCDNLDNCPKQCCRSADDPMFDLDTSLAWEMADSLESLCSTAHEDEVRKGRYIQAIDTLYMVVIREQESCKYTDLVNLCFAASKLADEVREGEGLLI